MSMDQKRLTRRAFLRGLGTVAIGLPFLDALRAGAAGAVEASTSPKRLVTVFFPNGMPPGLWQPHSPPGPLQLGGVLEPLRPVAHKLALVSGLSDPAGKVGAGDDHCRGSGAFGVGTPNPFLEADRLDGFGKRFAASAGGASIDQIALAHLRPPTPLPSLELGVMRAQSQTRPYFVKSWRGVHKPNPPILNPLAAFERLFGQPPGSGAEVRDGFMREARMQQSVLDTVVGEYRRLAAADSGLGHGGRARLDDHLEGLRHLERRLLTQDAHMLGSCLVPEAPEAYGALRYSDYAEVFALQAEILAAALRCDQVRLASVVLGSGGESLQLPGLVANHHQLGHQWHDAPDNAYADYTRFQMTLIAHLLAALDDPAYVDAEGRTVLDQSVVLIGTELSHPSRHDHDEMLYLVGGGVSCIKTKYHHRVTGGRAVNDLYAACLHALDVPVRAVGDEAFNQGPLDLA